MYVLEDHNNSPDLWEGLSVRSIATTWLGWNASPGVVLLIVIS